MEAFTEEFVVENGILKEYNGPGGDVIIPDYVDTIAAEAFDWCTKPSSITIPDSVTAIASEAFIHFQRLTRFYVDAHNAYYSANDDGVLFNKDQTTLIQAPNTISGGYRIPDSVTTIGHNAFSYCRNLTDVIIPNSVITIGKEAFWECQGLTNLMIPDSVTAIGKDAFHRCSHLTKITMPVHAGAFVAKAFDFSDTLRIDIEDLYALPAKYRICAALHFVEEIGLNTDPRFESLGKYLKANSGKLVDIAVRNLGLLALLCREGWIKAKDIEAYAVAVQQIGDAERITMILDYQNNKLSGKQKEQAAKQKEKQADTVLDRAIARTDKTGIAGLNFVMTGDVETFGSRKELKAFIESQGGKLQSSISAKTDYLIMNDAASNTEKKLRAEELGIAVITERQFNDKADRLFLIENGTLVRYIGDGGAVSIPNSVTCIAKYAFGGRKRLTAVTIPDGVTSICDNAFYDCEGLTTVSIPNSVTNIGENAFRNCKSLYNLTLPDSVTTIEKLAFSGCQSLTNLVIPGSIASISNSAFSPCTSLTTVTISDGVTSIGNQVFSGCSKLVAVTIPESVTEIGSMAFFKCHNFTIYGRAGSYAETYAKKYQIPFAEQA